MADKKKVLAIRVRQNCLLIHRFGKAGKPTGKSTKWIVKTRSNVPREMFFKTCGFIQQAIKRQGKKSVGGLMTAVRIGLEQAGRAFGCTIKKGSDRADLYWSVDGKLLIAWQVHHGELDERWAKKLRKSKALLRVVVVTNENGYFRIVPRDTRLKNR